MLLLALACGALGFSIKPNIIALFSGLGKLTLRPLLTIPLLVADVANQLRHLLPSEPAHTFRSFFTQGTKQPAMLVLNTQLCHTLAQAKVLRPLSCSGSFTRHHG